MKLYK